MTILPVQAKVTRTSAANGSSVDISGITGDWTLVLEVLAQNSGNVSRFIFQDSVDAFTNNIGGAAVSVAEATANANPRRFTFTKKDFPSLRFGVASAGLRLALAEITGSSKSVTYQAWIEY